MRLLVIGSGGREHALVWKLAQSPRITRMWCAPGNAGIARERLIGNREPVECRDIGADDIAQLLTFARESRVDLTVVGPDNPLALGIVDRFKACGLRIWGPNQSAARFESSKVFAQQFMQRHGIPTARAGSFTEAKSARVFAADLGGRCAVKADGLALGKGVLVCQNLPQAEEAIRDMLERQLFGEASRRIVIQEYLDGMEVSLHALCDGRTAVLFPTAQDHKRAQDGDQGPNTGGMGTYSPTPFLDAEAMRTVDRQILQPWLAGCAAEGIDYRGILYPGIMVTREGPRVLEFNARWGDPETQVYLARLESDLLDLFEACLEQQLDRMEIRWKPALAVCVVLASGGYPGTYAKGCPIHGLDAVECMANVKVFHAGTRAVGDTIVTNGGRVLGVTAWGATLAQARERAYEAVDRIRFDGIHFRRDIGQKALLA
jgi:phosphoribosylamine--glycine ligase